MVFLLKIQIKDLESRLKNQTDEYVPQLEKESMEVKEKLKATTVRVASKRVGDFNAYDMIRFVYFHKD